MAIRQTFNVGDEAGIATYWDKGTITKQNEYNVARAKKVKEWIDGNFSDIFTCSVTEPEGTSSSNSYTYIDVFFKGTGNGITICQSGYYVDDATGEYYYNAYGYIYGYNRYYLQKNAHLYKKQINLLLIKTKYGFITGFYKDIIDEKVNSIVIKNGNKLVPANVFGDDYSTLGFVSNGQKLSTSLLRRGTTNKIVLNKICLPHLDFIPEGVYLSTGYNVGGCNTYTVGDKSFAELQNQSYVTFAMQLDEASEDDYANIE